VFAYVIVGLLLVLLAGLALSVRVLKEYERAVMFRLGRITDDARGPGLVVFTPLVERLHRVSLRIVTMPIQPHSIITRDNVSVDVSAVAALPATAPAVTAPAATNGEHAAA
jgi:regulator of protease activity HflC (stomatin/prohibitin superfamily)